MFLRPPHSVYKVNFPILVKSEGSTDSMNQNEPTGEIKCRSFCQILVIVLKIFFMLVLLPLTLITLSIVGSDRLADWTFNEGSYENLQKKIREPCVVRNKPFSGLLDILEPSFKVVQDNPESAPGNLGFIRDN
jgi:hypothetical protein